MMAEVEEDTLLTIIIVCVMKKRKNESFGAEQLFSHEMIEILELSRSYEL